MFLILNGVHAHMWMPLCLCVGVSLFPCLSVGQLQQMHEPVVFETLLASKVPP